MCPNIRVLTHLLINPLSLKYSQRLVSSPFLQPNERIIVTSRRYAFREDSFWCKQLRHSLSHHLNLDTRCVVFGWWSGWRLVGSCCWDLIMPLDLRCGCSDAQFITSSLSKPQTASPTPAARNFGRTHHIHKSAPQICCTYDRYDVVCNIYANASCQLDWREDTLNFLRSAFSAAGVDDWLNLCWLETGIRIRNISIFIFYCRLLLSGLLANYVTDDLALRSVLSCLFSVCLLNGCQVGFSFSRSCLLCSHSPARTWSKI